ncbi:translocation/assembly module TamB domain-containing protein [Acinetobacter larvae]|uniref:Translocation and assembly module TamB C-terminal domain-containing protein n=1 Tax=Acinetobacter larvae TaxID=1789224 RepID=A0A1B2M017_9GAMM|nr:translocation/assembly module TamB domain-containing protein [Acinetobacter larvae]AOA58536.1 hypothetical protein BFG52_09360 [Acinetobacter larvae]
MAELEQQQPLTEQAPKKNKILRRIAWGVLLLLLTLIVSVIAMISTDRGSRFLLDRVMSQQQMIQYQYHSGNLLRGIRLDHLHIQLPELEIKADSADVSLGWRALLQKEIHLSHANLSQLQVINHAPPSDEPFKFSPIELPFVLRIDKAKLDALHIINQSSRLEIKDIALKDALWKGTRLSFEDAELDMGYLNVKKAKGSMQFEQKYPIQADAILQIPALESLNIQEINLKARGSLDHLKVGVATQTPDLLTGWAVLHPVRDLVPMQAQLQFKNYHWPLLTDQALLSKAGTLDLKGNIDQLNLVLNTDLAGQAIPKGQYFAEMHTDLVNKLVIDRFDGQLMQGAVDLKGEVNWAKTVNWDIKGRLNRLNAKDPVIPAAVADFLPHDLDAAIASTGNLQDGLHVQAQLDFDRHEAWQLKLDQAEAKNEHAAPMLLNVAWQKMNREMPYIGWLQSDHGQVDLVLNAQQQDIQLDAKLQQHEKSMLPAGQYQAKVQVKGDDLSIPSFSLNTGKGRLAGQAQVELPTEKRQLKWQAKLQAHDFNPQSISPQAPLDVLTGQIDASGFARPQQQIISLDRIDLQGHLAGEQADHIHLTGKSSIALLFADEQQGGAFKSFGVNYAGHLQSTKFSQGSGTLNFEIAGTPDVIKVNHFKHDGAAGKLNLSGLLNLKNGIGWNIDASLLNFKPHYFVSSIRGDISGQLKSQGIWAEKIKRMSVQQLNLAGTINNKILRGNGNLAVVLGGAQQGLLPEQFEANHLNLLYAGNQLQVTGNAQNLRLKVDAPKLYELYPGLRGRISGYLNLQAKPRLSATANLVVDDFGLNDLSIKRLSLIGELPTSDQVASQMKAQLTTLRTGGREIQHAAVTLSGTRKTHLLQLQGWNNFSKFYVQLSGGFNDNNDWLGQIQKGEFDSVRAHLFQNENAPVIYNAAKSELYVGQHCWSSKQSQLCFDQPVRVSQAKGNISFVSNNLDLKDFEAFMPEGLAMSGKLNGHAKASWAQGSHPKIDAQLVTRNGEIGLAAVDPGDPASTMHYDEASLVLKSIQDKLLLRVDLKAPNIGTGYANVVINPYSANKDMQGEVAFNQVQLKLFKPFVADIRKLEGTLSVAGKIGGTLTQPLFNGDLRVKNGSISMISLPVNLSNLQLYSAIRQDNATIDGAFNSGKGVGTLKGSIDWRNEPRIQLKLKGDQLQIRQAPMINAVVNSEVDVNILPFNRKITVHGDIDVPAALISMPETSATVINVSPDVRVVREGDDPLAILRAAKPWDVRADINVNLGKKVIFQGFNSRIPLVGRLYLTQRGLETAMNANGAIGVSQKVVIEAYGQKLNLNRAIARFNGPISTPSLDVDATKIVSGSTVGVRVTGTAAVPSIQIYNDAGLSEQEALNALITGRINEGSSSVSQTEGFKSDVNNTIAAAGISLGLGGTRAFTNQIGRTFGLSGLAFDAEGTGDDTQVSLTGYITPDLYIRYGVGVFTPVNKLTLRYQMNQRLYLEASQSLEKAIDIFYHWRF